jgi:5-formyltetrahydrofolate cyclo-ligase
MRGRRAALTPEYRREAALQVAAHAQEIPGAAQAQRIAAYLAVNGELDTHPLMEQFRATGKTLYLPILGADPSDGLKFAPWLTGQLLYKNRLGIPEPEHGAADLLPPEELDLVFAPLVAFDAAGNRLGMGGGYYDRSFAFLRDGARGPLLTGLGYSFQQVENLPARPWDIPLAAVVTDSGLHLTPAARPK